MFILDFYLLKVNNLFWMVLVWLLVHLASWQRHQLISGSHLSRFDLKATEFCRSGPYCACHRTCGKLVFESLLFPLSSALLFLYFDFVFLFTSLFQRLRISMDGPLWQTDTGTLLLSATVKGYGVSRSESTRRISGNLGWTKRYPGYVLI